MLGEPDGYWAKLDQDENGAVKAWNPLEAHCADVAACVEALLLRTKLRDRIATILGWDDLERVHIDRLSMLAALHDAGKVNHGFQARKKRGAPKVGHVVPIVDALGSHASESRALIEALNAREMLDWFDGREDVLVAMILATFGHHGRPVPIRDGMFEPPLWRAKDGRDPIAKVADLVETAAGWFPAARGGGTPFPDSSRFQHAFNGLLTLADWLGSDSERFFPYANPGDNQIERAREGASIALAAFGLNPKSARGALGATKPDYSLFTSFEPYPVQSTVLDLEVEGKGSLTILESDTGSGKTEAAIARFLRLLHAEKVDGLYFALPTRAAASQIYDRVCEAVAKTFGEAAPPVVQAVPGYISVDGERGFALPSFEVTWPDDDWNYRGWAAETPKRYLSAAVAVGTIDQVLMSTLKVRHAHMRAASLMRNLLVVDEVHASDAYMTRLLEEVLEHHLHAGGHAFLMSATLGSVARARLLGQPGAPLESTLDDGYPLVSHKSQAVGPRFHQTRASGYEKQVRMTQRTIAADPNALAEAALLAARDGARVLIIRNKVDECVETHQAIEALGGGRLLLEANGIRAPHHSRFTAADRKCLDRAIEMTFGKGGSGAGVIAVATQTVEQSLDIDADLLFTDLCPVDVLLQRIGRLHRHPHRKRPKGFEVAECVVVTPSSRDMGGWIDARSGFANGPHGLGTVYADLRVLEATLRLVEQEREWVIPKMNRELVERATHPDALDSIEQEEGEIWSKHANEVTGKLFADKSHAQLNVLDRDRPFGSTPFPSRLEERISTRLGASDRRVEFDDAVGTPFGNRVVALNLAEWMVRDVPGELESGEAVETEEGFAFTFGPASFHYSRHGYTRNSQD